MNQEVRFKSNEKTNNKILSLVVDKLYEEPIKASFREILSNAIDECVVANRNQQKETKEDVVVILESNNDKISITVKDYGRGISPDSINELYQSLFESTKEEEEDLIGSYGIGRLSPLSYSSSYNFKTVHDDTVYEYSLFKTDNGISLSLDDSYPKTTEMTGTEVYLPKVPSELSYIKEIRKQVTEAARFCPINIKLFENTKEVSIKDINDYNLFRGEEFAFDLDCQKNIGNSDSGSGIFVSINIGSMSYEIPKDILVSIRNRINNEGRLDSGFIFCIRPNIKRTVVNNYEKSNLYLFANQSDIDLNTSRERIQNTPKSQKFILNRLISFTRSAMINWKIDLNSLEEKEDLKQRCPCKELKEQLADFKAITYKGYRVTFDLENNYLFCGRTNYLFDIKSNEPFPITRVKMESRLGSLYLYKANNLDFSIPELNLLYMLKSNTKSELEKRIKSTTSLSVDIGSTDRYIQTENLKNTKWVVYDILSDQIKTKTAIKKANLDTESCYFVYSYQSKEELKSLESLNELGIIELHDLGLVKTNKKKKELKPLEKIVDVTDSDFLSRIYTYLGSKKITKKDFLDPNNLLVYIKDPSVRMFHFFNSIKTRIALLEYYGYSTMTLIYPKLKSVNDSEAEIKDILFQEKRNNVIIDKDAANSLEKDKTKSSLSSLELSGEKEDIKAIDIWCFMLRHSTGDNSYIIDYLSFINYLDCFNIKPREKFKEFVEKRYNEPLPIHELTNVKMINDHFEFSFEDETKHPVFELLLILYDIKLDLLNALHPLIESHTKAGYVKQLFDELNK